jgi:hypothetical protein
LTSYFRGTYALILRNTNVCLLSAKNTIISSLFLVVGRRVSFFCAYANRHNDALE